ncbi:hypothetical protein H0H81_004897 [Sphagnurus paluster]|uniref:F-box domain-containing protein n=1 Tax=Sphagnurus paluster TaxID=117069 RepID=A0A9P7FUI1_9AGAR|nr:hypothetical protein H0H81_004897 [Sphagnurus paluster]
MAQNLANQAISDLRHTLDLAEREIALLDTQLTPLLTQRNATISQLECIIKVLAPLALRRLPRDVLVEIFLLSMDGPITLQPTENRASPLADLAEVCSRWREVIMTSPILWKRVSVDFQQWRLPGRLTKSTLNCLSRAGTSTVSLHMKGALSKEPYGVISRTTPGTNPVRDIVIPFASRLREADLKLPYSWLKDFLSLPPGSINNLESIGLTFGFQPIVDVMTSLNADGVPQLGEHTTVFQDAPRLRQISLGLFIDEPVLGDPVLRLDQPRPPVFEPGHK